jgi:glycerate dehydrogenase
MADRDWQVINPSGSCRVVVTKDLPGKRWLQLLTGAGCRVEIGAGEDLLGGVELRAAVGDRCDAVVGQLTEAWSADALGALAAAGGSIYSQYAVGYDNVDVAVATRLGLAVGNTPGVLTETTAELAVALTFAAARRVVEGDRCMRTFRFKGWAPSLLLGQLLWRGRLGVVGAGRIGEAYARMLMEGHRMDVVYFDPRRNTALETHAEELSAFLEAHGERPLTCRRAASLEELLHVSDVVSIHTALDQSTRHLIGESQLAAMKERAILVNASRGPLVDEAALVEHCRAHAEFRAGLDVYEHEPDVHPGLVELDNVVLVPHLGSATTWARQGMAALAAQNVVAILNHWPVWPAADTLEDVMPFVGDGSPPQAAPSIINARDLGLHGYTARPANGELPREQRGRAS